MKSNISLQSFDGLLSSTTGTVIRLWCAEIFSELRQGRPNTQLNLNYVLLLQRFSSLYGVDDLLTRHCRL